MQKRTIMMLLVLLAIGATVNANSVWDPAQNGIFPPATGEWGETLNWTNGVPGPSPLDGKAVFNIADTAEAIVSDEQTFGDLVQADGGEGGVIRVVDGGSITTTGGWMSIGFNNTATLIVEKGGVCNFNGHMWLGMNTGGDGIIEINGGTINGDQSFGCGEHFGGTDDHGQCKIYLNTGELNLNHWSGAIDSENPVFWNDSFIDIKFGKMTIANDSVTAAQDYIDAGKITGFGTVGNVNIELVDGKTVMTANDPMNASPTMDEIVLPGDQLLSWTNKDTMNGATAVVDVWFGTDPNKTSGNYTRIITAGTGTVSVPVNAPDNNKYYWQVELVGSENPDPNSPVYFFYATDDSPPYDVYAGVDMITWINQPVQLGGEVQLGGTYIDDGVSPVTVTWSSDDPNAILSPSNDGGLTSNSLNPTVSVDYYSNVTLTFSVKDALNDAVIDKVLIEVWTDDCEAARLGAGIVYTSDFNEDCKVDIVDLATEIAAKWFLDYSLKAPMEITQ